jgi:hypothetical protein
VVVWIGVLNLSQDGADQIATQVAAPMSDRNLSLDVGCESVQIMGMSRTVEQKSNEIGFPKAGELIEITGAHQLSATDRAVVNLLYQHAHDSGRLTEQDAEWEMPLVKLRASKHESNDLLRKSIDRIMQVVVSVPFKHPKTGEALILKTGMFGFVEISEDEASPVAKVRFGLPAKLRPVLSRSNRWGRIKAEVVCAFTSKYASALYELIQLRANMTRGVETFPLDRFRALLGVPPGKLEAGRSLTQKVIQPALLEVNGVSDMGVSVELMRRSARAPIDAVTIAWWRKEGEEFRAASQERDRSKLGRLARLRGTVDQVVLARSKLGTATEKKRKDAAKPQEAAHDQARMAVAAD